MFFTKRKLFKLMAYIATAVVCAVIFFVCYISLKTVNQNIAQQQLDGARKAVEHAVTQCYSLEGSYPPSLEYLQDHYGLILNTKDYVYDYKIFANNIKPEVFVFEKK